MGYITDRYKIDKLAGQSLAVIMCGIQICDRGHTYGYVANDNYSVTFILEGKGKYYVNGVEYELGAGQGFIVMPGVLHRCEADENEPWKYVFAVLGGSDDTIIHNAGLDATNVTFEYPADEEMLGVLYHMHESSKNYDALGYDVTAYFMLAMSRLIKQNTHNNKRDIYPMQYLRQAVLYIENNYNRNITVKEIAGFVGIERTYLYKLFKKIMDTSPTAWLIDYRLKKATEMMENENVSINEIAYQTGFYDASHFHKLFIEKYKISPSKYRQKINCKEK